MADHDSMLFWLSRACEAARKAAGRRQVHIAASADVDQSTIARFEKGGAWPRRTDEVVAAYADDLDISAIDLWREALRLWQDDQTDGPAPPPDITPARRR